MQLLLQSQGVFGFGMLWLTSSNHMTPMKYVLSTVLDYIYIYIICNKLFTVANSSDGLHGLHFC